MPETNSCNPQVAGPRSTKTWQPDSNQPAGRPGNSRTSSIQQAQPGNRENQQHPAPRACLLLQAPPLRLQLRHLCLQVAGATGQLAAAGSGRGHCSTGSERRQAAACEAALCCCRHCGWRRPSRLRPPVRTVPRPAPAAPQTAGWIWTPARCVWLSAGAPARMIASAGAASARSPPLPHRQRAGRPGRHRRRRWREPCSLCCAGLQCADGGIWSTRDSEGAERVEARGREVATPSAPRWRPPGALRASPAAP